MRPPSRRLREAAQRQQGSPRRARSCLPDRGSGDVLPRHLRHHLCSSAAIVARRPRLPCARILRLACCGLATGSRACRCSIRLCGSGTIVVEAALIALDIAPGLKRTFGFQKLDWYDGPTWQRIKQAAQRRMQPRRSRRASTPATRTRWRSRTAPRTSLRQASQRRSPWSAPTRLHASRRRRQASSSATRPTACAWRMQRSWRRSIRGWATL